MNSTNFKKQPFYSSWIALIVFILLLVFQPARLTFYALRPADGWLMICLFSQFLYGYNIIIPFRNRFLIKNYGLFIGILAIIATLIQASYANLSLDISFVFAFYFFLRFLLIFKFVENILGIFNSDDAQKFWRVYTLMGFIVLILSYLEFNDIKAFKLLMVTLYYDSPAKTIEEYIFLEDRLAGVMGNPNSTAILLITTLPYPLLKIANKGSWLMERIIYGAYVLITAYVLVVMTGSRTAIFIALLMNVIILVAASRRFKDLLLVILITLLLATIGAYLYQQFESKIIVQDRITKAIHGEEDFQLSAEGFGKWTGRYELWQDRLNTFKREGNQLVILLGLGYTRAYEDFADNGLLSAFINNGLIGLILKLFLFYIFLIFGFLRALRYYVHFKIDYTNLAFALCAFALLLVELTIDVTQHYKLGQFFYAFISIVMIINGKLFSTNS
jgi:hypothetical protein